METFIPLGNRPPLGLPMTPQAPAGGPTGAPGTASPLPREGAPPPGEEGLQLRLELETMQREKLERTLAKAERTIKALSACTTASVQVAGEEEFLSRVCRIAVEAGGYRLAWIGYAQQDSGRTIRPMAQYGYEAGYLETLHLTWSDKERGRGPVGTAIRTGAPSLVRDVRNNPRFAPWRDQAIRRGYASVISLPLKLDNRVLGALTLYAAEADAFDVDEVGFLLDLVNTVSFGIGGLRADAERKVMEAHDLRAFQTRITISALLETSLEPLSLSRQLQVALDIILAVPWLAVKSKGSIFLFDPHSGILSMEAQRGLHQHLLSHCDKVPMGYCLCGRASQTREIVFAGDLDQRHDVHYEGISAHGHYCVPILHQQNLLGVLNLYLAPGHRRNPEEEAFLTAIANTLAGIIKQRRLERELEREREFISAVLDTAAALVVVLAPNGTIVETNRYARQQLASHLDLTGEQLTGRYFFDIFTVEGEELESRGSGLDHPETFETSYRSREGMLRHVAWSSTTLRDANALVEFLVCTGLDVTDRKRAEERIRHMAHHDALTGLPNRLLFQERLSQGLALNRRHRGLLALLFMDLDRFKQVNDTLGHEVGDLLLQEAARRIGGSLRQVDTVARLGGDEFTVILPEITHPEDALLVARKIIDRLNEPFLIGPHRCQVGASVGIVLHPLHGDTPDDLLRRADLALYAVKERGRNDALLYHPELEGEPGSGEQG